MNTAQDDAVMAGASGTQTVAAADGRTLTIAEWGDPDGFPVFLLHGTPGSRFVGQADASAYASVGARVITYDRPGYGGSDRFRGRRVVDSVADVSAIADSLGIERFAVSGGSWGGPHSLAVAARLPERVTRAACSSGGRAVRHAWLRLVRGHGRGQHRGDRLGTGRRRRPRSRDRPNGDCVLERLADDPSKGGRGGVL